MTTSETESFVDVNDDLIRNTFYVGALLVQEENGLPADAIMASFDQWLAETRTDAYFRGADSMGDQIFEDYNIEDFPQSVSPFEDVEWLEWKDRKRRVES